MSKPEIISESPVNIVELKGDMEKIKKRDKELNFRAERTYEYLNHVVQIQPSKAKEIYDKIEKLGIPRLKDVHIHKIIDNMPTSTETLKAILQAYVITVSSDNIKKIISIFEEYVEDKK